MDEMKQKFALADVDSDGYISASQLGELMRAFEDDVSDEDAAEMIGSIESEQGIRKRMDSGEPLIFFEQWTKYVFDTTRATQQKKKGGGFKWPF